MLLREVYNRRFLENYPEFVSIATFENTSRRLPQVPIKIIVLTFRFVSAFLGLLDLSRSLSQPPSKFR